MAIGGQISLDLTAGVAQDEKKGMSVVRLIADLTATLITAGTGGLVSMGVCLISGEAATAASLPEPTDVDQEASWMWKVMNRLVASSSVNDRATWTPFFIDTHVRRRIRFEEQQLRWIAGQVGGTDNITINGHIRVLMQKS